MTSSLNDHEYPESVIRATTLQNLEDHSSSSHRIIELYTLSDNCEHINPDEDDAKYGGLDDEIDAWMERNCAGLSSADIRGKRGLSYSFIWNNRQRAENVIPRAIEFSQASDEYSANHGYVCMLSPMGSCCEACSEGDDDCGYEPGDCYRQQRAKEEHGEFWDLFTQANLDWIAQEKTR